MSAITKRQREVLDFIGDFTTKNRYSPTFEEIAKGINLRSLATVSKHLSNLRKKGYLTHDPNKSRSIEVVGEAVPSGRFKFEGPHHLWDEVEACYWVREKEQKL